jgi:hypothetical protein
MCSDPLATEIHRSGRHFILKLSILATIHSGYPDISHLLDGTINVVLAGPEDSQAESQNGNFSDIALVPLSRSVHLSLKPSSSKG